MTGKQFVLLMIFFFEMTGFSRFEGSMVYSITMDKDSRHKVEKRRHGSGTYELFLKKAKVSRLEREEGNVGRFGLK